MLGACGVWLCLVCTYYYNFPAIAPRTPFVAKLQHGHRQKRMIQSMQSKITSKIVTAQRLTSFLTALVS